MLQILHTGSCRKMRRQVEDRVSIVHWGSATDHVHGDFADDAKGHFTKKGTLGLIPCKKI